MPDDTVFCIHCFSSREQLPASLSPVRRGSCPWCGARNEALYPMHALSDRFRELAAQYPEAESFEDEPNDLLYKQIQHDWDLFDDSFAASERFPDFIDALLRSGLDNDEAYGERDSRSLVRPIEPQLLNEFKEALGDSLFTGHFWEHFSLPGGPPLSWYDAFLEDMAIEVHQEAQLFRARGWDRNIEKERFNRSTMGAPPLDKVSTGRSNRRCQTTLYCSGDIDTCIAEVRPYRGAGVAVSAIKLSRGVRVIDFASTPPALVPLCVENVGWRIQARKLFEHISYLFSLPANPSASELYYAPTQALCDSLREAGYDGIRYRSSLKDGGINYAFFKPDIGIPEEPEYRWIDEISIQSSDVEPYDTEHPYAYDYWRSHP